MEAHDKTWWALRFGEAISDSNISNKHQFLVFSDAVGGMT